MRITVDIQSKTFSKYVLQSNPIFHRFSLTFLSYFHGFLESTEAQKALKGKPDNTYLVRFSGQNIGCYALSVSYNNTVGHWRISSEKKMFQDPIFKIDGREYKSLADIIQTHSLNAEPLKIKQPKDGQSGICYLGSPLIRQEASEDYYQVTWSVKRKCREVPLMS